MSPHSGNATGYCGRGVYNHVMSDRETRSTPAGCRGRGACDHVMSSELITGVMVQGK